MAKRCKDRVGAQGLHAPKACVINEVVRCMCGRSASRQRPKAKSKHAKRRRRHSVSDGVTELLK